MERGHTKSEPATAPSRVIPAVAATLPILFSMFSCGLYGLGAGAMGGVARLADQPRQ